MAGRSKAPRARTRQTPAGRCSARLGCLGCRGCLSWLACALIAIAALPASASREQRRAPQWNVSGRWDGSNGAEYVVFRQRSRGTLAITVHHTCAPGHLERGRGRIRGSLVKGRVEPAERPAPPACAGFATIDVRVAPDGRRMRGSFATDRSSGELIYIARRRARSLVRFHPKIVRRRREQALQVLLRARPALPAGALARVRLCIGARCATREGAHGPLFELGRRCGVAVARVRFADTLATTRRRLCT